MATDVEKLLYKLREFNQDHLLQFWDEISDDQKLLLIRDIEEQNLKEISSYFKSAVASLSNDQVKLDAKLRPIPSEVSASLQNSTFAETQKYHDLGLREIADGRTAVLLMAGGQGTRLGVSYPKGMFNVGLPSGKSLFQLQAERIRRLENLAEERHKKKGSITWYILTSEATTKTTRDYFKANNYFGLKEDNVLMFEQGMLPCFNFDGKIILDEKHRLARAPDGNGGLYRALKVQGILQDMDKRSIRSVHAHSVDNILVKVADPIFIGYCLSRSADCGAKVVEKSSPTEAVGVVCQVDGVYQVVEYSEITEETASLRDENGRLKFIAGNICNHYFTKDFLQSIADVHEFELKLHVAKKKIPYVDQSGVRIVPEKPNGIKIEKFVFDVFQFSKQFAVWEVARDEEFSALKNNDSAKKDCPSTARNDLIELHKKWLLNSGATLVEGDIEISPLLSYAGENLDVKGKILKGPVVLQ
ncbi:UDP-N-acetylhexosamine pyrophosphorylase [Neodiprion pinetum]|uniref:UDP-N-acetylhexosamine pyrophosphorylase n=1 Tax=Neodiprion pinetum TaxID=441929 RepID=UPI001EDE13B1|nr:UDP-N-acetylhexosamine pyrophosphorylase [Neodiprion pinetum]